MRPPTLRHKIEYGLVLTVRALVRWVPESVARAVGAVIGLTFYAVDGGHRRLAVAQLGAAFPLRSQDECRTIARNTFIHFGQLLVAVLRASTLSPQELLQIAEFEGEERVRAALAQGKGAIIFSGHFGHWEMHVAHALVLPPMSVIARPLDNPYLHAMLERVRQMTGNRVVYRQGGLRKILRALQSNECVAIQIDQHIQGTDAVLVEFFNRPAATTTALATLALRTGAPLIPAFIMPVAHGRYRIIYEHPIEMPGPNATDPVRELTQRCTDVLEMYVRRHPHLWLWMHRRWRDVPPPAGAVPGMFPAGAPDETETVDG